MNAHVQQFGIAWLLCLSVWVSGESMAQVYQASGPAPQLQGIEILQSLREDLGGGLEVTAGLSVHTLNQAGNNQVAYLLPINPSVAIQSTIASRYSDLQITVTDSDLTNMRITGNTVIEVLNSSGQVLTGPLFLGVCLGPSVFSSLGACRFTAEDAVVTGSPAVFNLPAGNYAVVLREGRRRVQMNFTLKLN